MSGALLPDASAIDAVSAAVARERAPAELSAQAPVVAVTAKALPRVELVLAALIGVLLLLRAV